MACTHRRHPCVKGLPSTVLWHQTYCLAAPGCGGRAPTNDNCTGLAQIVGQLQGSGRGSPSKCWAKSRDVGRPGTRSVPGAGAEEVARRRRVVAAVEVEAGGRAGLGPGPPARPPARGAQRHNPHRFTVEHSERYGLETRSVLDGSSCPGPPARGAWRHLSTRTPHRDAQRRVRVST